MHSAFTSAFITLTVLIGTDLGSAQQIPSTTTAAELWNPWTWFWPYAIASAESYRDYYEKAQKATNELYQQIYKTNANPLITGIWGPPESNPGKGGDQNNQEGSTGQNNQEGSTGQSDQEGSTGQNTQEGSTGQSDQTNTESTPKEEAQTEEIGAQVQGNVQDDGTSNSGVN